MASYAVREARQARDRARDRVVAHDADCGTCNVRKRVRCDEGMTLVHALWGTDAALDKARTTGNVNGQLALFPARGTRR